MSSEDDAANSNETAQPRHVVGRPFEKGKSGNPTGRPKESQEYRDAMERLDAKAIRGLETILDDPEHKRFADVCIYVVNRNHGQPIKAIDHSSSDGSMSPLGPDTLGEALRSAIAQRRRAEQPQATEAPAVDDAGPK